MNSVGSEASIHKAAGNTNNHADNVCDPVTHVGAAVKTWLDEFDHTTEGTRSQKHGGQPNAPGSGQREGECRKGNEVDDLVAAVWRRRRGFQGPEHCDRQGEGHDEGDWDVEIFSH